MGRCRWCNFPFPPLFLFRFVIGRRSEEQKRRGKSWFVNLHSSHYPQRESCYGRRQMRNDIPRYLKRPFPNAAAEVSRFNVEIVDGEEGELRVKNWCPTKWEKIAKTNREVDVGEIVPGDTMTSAERNTEKWSQRGSVGDFCVAVSKNPARRRETGSGQKRNIQDAYRCRIIYISNLRLEFI